MRPLEHRLGASGHDKHTKKVRRTTLHKIIHKTFKNPPKKLKTLKRPI
jgi:hypothetical protein